MKRIKSSKTLIFIIILTLLMVLITKENDIPETKGPLELKNLQKTYGKITLTFQTPCTYIFFLVDNSDLKDDFTCNLIRVSGSQNLPIQKCASITFETDNLVPYAYGTGFTAQTDDKIEIIFNFKPKTLKAFFGASTATNIEFENFESDEVEDMSYMFYGAIRITSLNLSGLNTSSVTDMTSMFESS